jgi:sterol desaturase/sphingolipid hydroxylase (fatty acid hydroxylase superfamily)
MNAIAIAASVPIFFLLIGIERAIAGARGLATYRLTDSINSLSCGVVQQATAIFVRVLVIGAYALIHERFALFTFSHASVLAWVALFLLVDHQYYWMHRAMHRVNFLWATHVVHHQSEEYNLSTALRQSALQGVAGAPFYWPLAILGFDTEMFVAVSTANTLYQFWIHTRLIDRLGPLELVFNTPSHHRVHHAIDPEYIDKNHAGMLIVWDRLYGTYVEEKAVPSYGTVKPLASWNPVWANLEHWSRMLELARGATTLREKVWTFFAPPEWRPAAMGGNVTIPAVDREHRVLYDTATSAATRAYVAVQFALVGVAIVAELLLSGSRSVLELGALAGWITVSTVAWGALFEQKSWARGLEAARLIALPILCVQLGPALTAAGLVPSATPAVIGTAVAALGSLVWLSRLARA